MNLHVACSVGAIRSQLNGLFFIKRLIESRRHLKLMLTEYYLVRFIIYGALITRRVLEV